MLEYRGAFPRITSGGIISCNNNSVQFLGPAHWQSLDMLQYQMQNCGKPVITQILSITK